MVDPVDAWGGDERYYSGPGFRNDGDEVSRNWEQTLKRHDPGVESAVQRAVQRWNQQVRKCLITETGLHLDGRRVSVHVVSGASPRLSAILSDSQGRQALTLQRALLEGVVDGMAFMTETRELVRDSEGALIGAVQPEELLNVHDTARAWLNWADDNDVSKKFVDVPEDLFGAYRDNYSKVEVYWLPIAIFAAGRNIPVEALTVVVLAHELAHAYTHCGRDIDGFDWGTGAFEDTHVAVVEGLAQFYTALVCYHLRDSLPAAEVAFDTLLKSQHPIYHAHKTWIKGAGRHSGEVVRTGMVECRRTAQPMDKPQFDAVISSVTARLATADST